MAFAINPPNAPLTDGKGMVTATWYRFFAQIQKLVGGDLLESIVNAPFLTTEVTSALPNERALTVGSGLDLTFTSQLATVSLTNSGVAAGVYGLPNALPQITVDSRGRITFAAQITLITDNVTEGVVNLFYTDARARQALSAGAGIDYDDTTGSIALQQTLDAGTYTPTATLGANAAAATALQCTYTRVGDIVSVSGRVNVQATAAAALTVVGIPLPIASNFGSTSDCNGVTASAGILQAGAIEADVASDTAALRFIAQDTTSRGMVFNFSYTVI